MIDSIKTGLDLSAKKAFIESTLGTAGFSGCLLAYSLFVMARQQGLRGTAFVLCSRWMRGVGKTMD